MILFEILYFNRELINRLQSVGFKPDDCRYIDLYSDYVRMYTARGQSYFYCFLVVRKIRSERAQNLQYHQTLWN